MLVVLTRDFQSNSNNSFHLFPFVFFFLKMCNRSSENVEYATDDAERFRYAYRTHFSDSFQKIFSEVLSVVPFRVLILAWLMHALLVLSFKIRWWLADF